MRQEKTQCLYRVTIEVDSSIPLTSKQSLWFSAWASYYRRLESTCMVALYFCKMMTDKGLISVVEIGCISSSYHVEPL